MVKSSIHIISVSRSNENHNFRTGSFAGKKHLFVSRTKLNEELVNDSVGKRRVAIKKIYKELFKDVLKNPRAIKKGKKDDGSEVILSKKKQKNRKMQSNAQPIREGVINLLPEHGLDDLIRLGEVLQERFGITPFQWFIHRDEGRQYDSMEDIPDKDKVHKNKDGNDVPPREIVSIDVKDKKTDKMVTKYLVVNNHGHIVFDWQDKKTGRMINLDQNKMIVMQTLVAKTLGMTRGDFESKNAHLRPAVFTEFKALVSECEAELGKAQDELTKANTERVLAAEALTETNDEHDKAKLALETSNKKIADLDQKYQTAQNEINDQLSKDLAAAKPELVRLDQEYKNVVLKRNKAFQELTDATKRRNDIIKKLRSDELKLQNDYGDLRVEVGGLETSRDKLEPLVAKLKTTHAEEEVLVSGQIEKKKDLRQNITSLKTSINNLKTSNEKLKESNNRQNIKDYVPLITSISTQNSDLKTNNQSLREQSKKLNAGLTALSKPPETFKDGDAKKEYFDWLHKFKKEYLEAIKDNPSIGVVSVEVMNFVKCLLPLFESLTTAPSKKLTPRDRRLANKKANKEARKTGNKVPKKVYELGN